MKKQIALTIVLLAAAAWVTRLYFNRVNLPDKNTAGVIQAIPGDAALILNFGNDDSFYDIYDSSALFTSLVDTTQLAGLKALKEQVFKQEHLKPIFYGQPVYLSVHPTGELMLTMRLAEGYSLPSIAALLKQAVPKIRSSEIKTGKVTGLKLFLNGQPPFTIIDRGNHIYSGSFADDILTCTTAGGSTVKYNSYTALLSSQQQAAALANLYVNYINFTPLINHWFGNTKDRFFNMLGTLPANAALTLNYKKDALMFSGFTAIAAGQPATYLTLFNNQRPYKNQLKSIFPSITAYSTCLAANDPIKFQQDLAAWQRKAGLSQEREALQQRIRHETGISVANEFHRYLGNEFATITTRFDEQLAIIQLKNGQLLKPVLDNISTVGSDSTGRLNYAKLPYFLLGDAFSQFRQPYYQVIDNYLILANSTKALNNYRQIYASQNFLSRHRQFNEFNNLQSDLSNVCFYVNFKNASFILKRNLSPATRRIVYPPAGKNRFLAGSYQLSGSGGRFYTNFCMQLDSTAN